MHPRRRSIALTLCAVVVMLAAVGATPAYAEYSLGTIGTPDYERGLLPIRVTTDSSVDSVTLTCVRAGTPDETILCSQESPGVFVAMVAPGAETAVSARAYVAGAEVWASGAPVVLRARDHIPTRPGAAAASRSLVRSPRSFSGTVGSVATTVVVEFKRGSAWTDALVTSVIPDASGSVRLPPVTVPKGSSSVRLVSANAFGWAIGPARTVYNLGKTPSYKKYVLVDKSDRRLYEVHSGVVKFTTGVAIGMPWAPTPSGTFKLGKRMRTPNAVWGPWRMPFLKKTKGGKWVRTAYYLHGTNRPSSIGKRASHGCVRVLNKHIRVLSKRLKGYTIVVRP